MTDRLDDLNVALAGRYEIERQIGQGGMATVYLAEDGPFETWSLSTISKLPSWAANKRPQSDSPIRNQHERPTSWKSLSRERTMENSD
jgi:serine/threonine protein kinase